MSTRMNLGAVRLVTTNADALGIKLPKRLAAAITAHDKRIAQLNALADVPPDCVAKATLAALDVGKEPSTDPAVQQALTAIHLIDTLGGTEDHSFMQVVAVVNDEFDNFVTAARPVFDSHATTMATAQETIGTLDLSDARGILARGGSAAEAWNNARAAIEAVRRIEVMWEQLATTFGSAHWLDPRWHILAIASTGDYSAYSRFNPTEARNFDLWAALGAGWKPGLATRDEYEGRLVALQAQTSAANAVRSHGVRGLGELHMF